MVKLIWYGGVGSACDGMMVRMHLLLKLPGLWRGWRLEFVAESSCECSVSINQNSYVPSFSFSKKMKLK